MVALRRASESASSGLEGSSIRMRSAPRPGQHPAGRGGQPVALTGGDELLHRLAVLSQSGRKDPPVPRDDHDAAAIAGELVGEILGIADAEDLCRGIVPEQPGRKGD